MFEMRESWTDGRLDDFAAHVDKRFDAVDKRFDRVEGEIRAVREDGAEMRQEMNRRFDSTQEEMNRRFDSVQKEMYVGLESMQKEMHRGFEGIQRTMLQASVAVIVALIALIATQI
jgi:DNA anti-recombination protein RmuC